MNNQPDSTKTASTLPLVALIGPTNAGKSTLFNRLTGSWQAVTAKEESTTRDRVYGEVTWQKLRFNVIDTGGLTTDASDLYQEIKNQTVAAINEADLILFVYDGRAGLQPNDQQFLNQLRTKKTVWLVANKIDTYVTEQKLTSLHYLDLPFHALSASTGRGVGDLLEELSKALPLTDLTAHHQPVVALIGRPNVGKSTLLNTLVAENRAVVSPIAGTTRDVVTAQLTIGDRVFLLADTAGVRRRGKIEVGPEKFSVKRTLTTIAQADAVLVLIDANEGTTRGDLHLLYYAKELEKPTLLIINKIDTAEGKNISVHQYLHKFDQVLISAKENTNTEAVTTWLLDHTPIQ